MKRNAKRLLALLLVLTLCVGLFPGVAFAEGAEDSAPAENDAPGGSEPDAASAALVFTVQPEDGEIPDGESYAVSWDLSLEPERQELLRQEADESGELLLTLAEELPAGARSWEIEAPGTYHVRAWLGEDCALSESFTVAPAEEPEAPAPTEAGEDEPLQPAEPAAPPEGEPEDAPDALPDEAEPNAAASGSCGDNLTWTLDDTGTLTISGTGDMWNYAYNNTAPWYGQRGSIRDVVLEPGVTSIGDYAFYECENLASVAIPEGVTSIGDGAFQDCSLTSVTIPEGVTSIGNYAFQDCSLTSITIPEGVTTIGNYAFENCSRLTSITIPASVTSIGWGVFRDCSRITEISVNVKNPAYKSEAGILYDKDMRTLVQCPSGKAGSLSIPAGVKRIELEAFSCCRSLTSITLPEGVTSIGNSAFYVCSSLMSVTIPASVTYIGDYAFAWCSSLTSVMIPEGVTSIGHGAFSDCTSLTAVTIPASVTGIGGYAFYGCSSLTSITIPTSVTSIGDDAFAWCESLTSVTIPEGVANIGDGAFEFCSSLTSITLPEGVTTIGSQAFSGCRSLTDIYYGGTVFQWNALGAVWDRYRTTVHCSDGEILPAEGNYCGDNLTWTLDDRGTLTISGTGDMWDFDYNTMPWDDQRGSIREAVLEPGVTGIGGDAFYYCSSLTSIAIPEGVTSIGNSAFYVCSSLMSVTIPEGVTSIGYGAFYYCSSLTSVTIPEGVTSIGNEAFSGCSSLTDVTIPESVTFIGDYAFYGCGFSNITIPEGVTSIGDETFCNCTSLTSVVIPASVTSFGPWAFADCSSLASILFTGSAPAIEDNVFQSDTLTAYYPANDPTWTEAVRQNYGGSITWVPYELDLSDSSSLRLDREYLILEEGDAVSLTLPAIPGGLLSLVTWSVESAEAGAAAAVQVSAGLVTAVAPGSAWVKAELSLGGTVFTARCRVDVVADQAGVDSPIADDVKWNGVRLTSSKATVELFKTDYARVEIIPVLSRNISAQSNVIPQSPEIPEGVGAIRSARFASDAANELFALRVADDRTLEIIPRDSALLLGESKPASIKGSYKTTILVNVDGTELETGALTLTVKKSKPAVTVKAVKLNSAFRGDEQPLVFTGGTVTAIEPVGTAPGWLRVDAENLRLGYDGSANGKNSAKLKLLVTVDGWALRKELTVSVSSAPTAPTISPKAATLTLLPAAGNEVSTTVTVSPAVYTDAERFPITVSRIEEAKVGSFENGSVLIAEIAGGVLTVKPGPALDSSKAHSFKLYLSVNGKEKAVTVKTTALKAPTLTVKAAGFVDSALPGSSITLTATAKSYFGLCEPVLRVQKTKAATKTSPAVDEDVTGLFVLTPAPGQGTASVTLRAADPAAIEKGYTYTAYLSLRLPDGSQTAESKVKLNLKWSDPAKLKASATVKATGFIDVLRADSEAKLTPTVKNCYDWAMTPGDLTVTRTYDGSAKQKVSEDWTDRFAVRVENGAWFISIREGAAVSHADKFTVSAIVRSPSAGELAAKAVTVTVKQGTVKISQSVKAVTLLRDDRFSRGVVTLTPADSALRIARVELDSASLTRFELTELENGAYAIGLAGNRLNTAKTATVKLRVFLEGNLTATPNATISVKVSFQ